MNTITSSLMLLACAVSSPACDLCSVYSVGQARGESGRGFFSGLAGQFTHFETLQQDGERVPNETDQRLESAILQWYAGYNFNDRSGIQLNVPLIHRWFERPEGFATDRDHESGIGDIVLLGHYRLFETEKRNFTFSTTVLGGVKAPTGSTRRLKEELNEVEIPGAPESGVHGHDLTLGSGSWDGIAGAAFFVRSHRVFLAASTQYAIRTEGDFSYEFANDLTWTGGPGLFLVLNEALSAALAVNVSGEHKGRDAFAGTPAEDTGLTAVYLGPELSVTGADKWSAQLGFDIPVSIGNTALQLVPDLRVRAGFTWRF